MNKREIFSASWKTCLAFFLVSTARAQVNVTTWHNDGARTGANTSETVLTPANVGVKGNFGKLFSVSVDGEVYAQPLYLSGLKIAGGTHNVLFVATEHDSVYAIDADNGKIYWKNNFLHSGMTTVPSTQMGCRDINPEIGITGTPVIDTASGTLYVVGATMPGPTQHLHALNVSTGAEKFWGPKYIWASIPGKGAGADWGKLNFSAMTQNQRPALSLVNGHVIITWASHCDYGAYHGWVMSYSAATLAQEAVYNTAPNGADAGIWMAGAAPATDATGNIYFATGNGTFDGSTSFGSSILKLPPPKAGTPWQLASWFTPWNQSKLDADDYDVGSGGLVLLPDLPAGSAHPQLLVQAPKTGTIYVVDRNNMGGYCSACATTGRDTNIVQEIPWKLIQGLRGSPAYWNGAIYFGGSYSNLRAFSFNRTTGLVSPPSGSAQQGTYTFGLLGPTPSISSNGNADGILWAVDSNSTTGELLIAYNAGDLATALYTSPIFDKPVSFVVPTVANGKVYVGSATAVTAFGLLHPAIN